MNQQLVLINSDSPIKYDRIDSVQLLTWDFGGSNTSLEVKRYYFMNNLHITSNVIVINNEWMKCVSRRNENLSHLIRS